MLQSELKKYKARYNNLFPLNDTKENFIKIYILLKYALLKFVQLYYMHLWNKYQVILYFLQEW